MLTWPVSIVSVVLYMLLFYQIRLYFDALEQVYYLVASCNGWRLWHRVGTRQEQEFQPYVSAPRTLGMVALIAVGLGLGLGVVMSQIHLLLPAIFPEPAAFPYLDALMTMVSFSALWLMAQKRLESWGYWIGVDVIGSGLYDIQGVRFISLLYVILLILTIHGLLSWRRSSEQSRQALAL